MYSLKLWHFLVTLSVVSALISLAVHHLFIKETQWQQASAIGLEKKVNICLKQIYWQWQSEGRPEQILYQPEHATRAIAIRLRDDGTPDFDVNPDSCRAFINWFVDGVSVDAMLDVRTQKDSSLGAKSAAGAQQTGAEQCRFNLSNNSFAYHASTAEISR